ncbi:MAG: hypothetical protein M1821_001408 [Bathelium mastoideum]|nr:MAG: hypothetical protein M1821_001408 [Bathelium mastoideum]
MLDTITQSIGTDWQDTAIKKRNETYEKIPRAWRLSPSVLLDGKSRRQLIGDFFNGILDEETLHITTLDVADLLTAIRSCLLSSRQVVSAFCKRAAYAHQLNNNILEILFTTAFSRADYLDRYLKEHGSTIGPLHGLPVTLKDQFHITGVETSMAWVGWIGTFEGKKGTGKEKVIESDLTKDLWSLGAVPIAKTSLVQSLWYGETNNNIIGYTMNPHNQHLSAGGSSGGEGALQALRGSAIGFGTDIGGSVSIPSAFNGIFSIKPSHGRLPFKDAANSSPGQMIIPTVVGIMGASITSLQIMFRSLLSTRPWLRDPECISLPWRAEMETIGGSRLSFGFMQHDGVVLPHPPILRALRIVSQALKAGNHKLVKWEPPSHAESSEIHRSFTEADGGADIFGQLALSGEPLIPELQRSFGSGPRPPLNVLEFYKNTIRLKEFRARYQEYWSSTSSTNPTGAPVDAVILPIAPHAAVIPGKYIHYTYSSIINVLDYTTVVIPVTKADSRIDVFDSKYKPMSEKDEKNWKAYDAEMYDGAPASIQVMCRRHEEEKVLAIAQVVVDALEEYRREETF